ncbi:MAG: ACP phosphodiesterase [Chitinophagaceae bacterium]
MNFLAHAYLSFREPDLLLGNLISDFVKGKKNLDYPIAIQKGIQLHRAIDRFTDLHPSTLAIKEIYRPDYRLYGGAFGDIIYDHFLAIDPKIFPASSLTQYTDWVYQQLDNMQDSFPQPFAQMYPYMKRDNWLLHYKDPKGIARSFQGLVRRAKYLTESEKAWELFLKHYPTLQQLYDDFFPSVESFARQLHLELLAND